MNQRHNLVIGAKQLTCTLLLFGLFSLACGCGTFSSGGKQIRMVTNSISHDGFRGTSYLENGVVVSEELDAKAKDGRFDLWRFYNDGKLTREMRDLDSNGTIDLQITYNRDHQVIVGISRHKSHNSPPYMRLKYKGRGLWRQELDSNGDGRIDSIFSFKAPEFELNLLKPDVDRVEDYQTVIPKRLWFRIDEDTNHDGQPDCWTLYREGLAIKSGIDRDGNGLPDKWMPFQLTARTE
ncbi:MAG: hypothetical protein ACYTGH_01055 [Planctomycetota bacterium]|jgi:hypothetical protein